MTNPCAAPVDDTDLGPRLRTRGWDLVYDRGSLDAPSSDDLKSILDRVPALVEFGNRAYPNGVTLRRSATRFSSIFGITLLGPAKMDLAQGRLDLLAMDFIALGYMPYRDFRLWMDKGTARLS